MGALAAYPSSAPPSRPNLRSRPPTAPEQNPPRRIIFYKSHEGGWSWAQEWSFDGGKTWVEVYRIKATPWRS